MVNGFRRNDSNTYLWMMTKKTFRGFIILMTISTLMLILLQAFWLRAEYRSASDSFRRETNLAFRSTMFHLSDSIFSGFFRQIADGYGSQGEREPFSITFSSTGQGDSIPLRHSVRINRTGYSTPESGNDKDSSFVIAMNPYTLIDPDDLAVYFGKELKNIGRDVNLRILTSEADWPGSFRETENNTDSLPFATSFVPMGAKSYAADFEGVQTKLLISLLPQFGFSVFITLMIVVSFVLVAKNLRSQQRLIEQKNDLIGNITHELKTPVATVEAVIEALKHFDVLDNREQTHEYLDMAGKELNRLGLIADKILQTSVVDYSEEIRLYKNPVDMNQLAGNVIASFRILAENKGVTLVFESDGKVFTQGHETHLTQMIYNLVDNALKYGSAGKTIRLSLTYNEELFTVSVCDKGPGIPDAHKDKIFEKFYRIPSGNVHDVKGYGLGLYYVKGVVKAHGGRIQLVSKPGEGSCFKIILPRHG